MKVYQINMSVKRIRCMCGARNFLRLTETIFDYMFEWRIEDFVSATLVIFDEKCSTSKTKGGELGTCRTWKSITFTGL